MFAKVINNSKPQKLIIYLSTVLCGLSLLFIFTSSASASSIAPQDIEIAPSSVELSAPPGGTAQGSITVINGGSSSFNVSLYADPYYVTGINYNPTFMLLPGKTDASKWVQISGPTSASIAPNDQSDTVNYSLHVPVGTAPGGYYAVLFAETQPSNSGGVSSHSRVGDILYITVQGPVTQSGHLLAVKMPKIVFGSSLPLTTEVSDTGGLHFITTANFDLINAITKHPVFSASLPRYVLPQTIRKISTNVVHTPLIGLYKIEVNASILGKTQSLPNQWVLIIHPVALVFIPILVILIIIYVKLPKSGSKRKYKSRQ